MDLQQAIVASMTQSDFVVNAYLADLTPEDLLARPVPSANHIAWQLGHLIASERYLIDKAVPGAMDALPPGFEAQHKKETADKQGASDFLSKEEYLSLARKVRANTLRIARELAPADFDRPLGAGVPPVVKTAGEMFLFVGAHWLMHAGQWAILRRTRGRAPLF